VGCGHEGTPVCPDGGIFQRDLDGRTPTQVAWGILFEKGGAPMTLRLGDIAPDFTQESTEGTIRFHEWMADNWADLFSHPRDYTPVCTTELGEVARLKSEFANRNVKVIGLSVDPLKDHVGWSKDIEETQSVKLNFPLLADGDRKVSDLYGMIHPS